MPTDEEKWHAEFEELGLTEVCRQINVGGYDARQKKRNAAIKWVAEKERARLNLTYWAIGISVGALVVSILSFLVALLRPA
jgi:hypothetical protein